MDNVFKVGDKVNYNGKPATVIEIGKPFAEYPTVVLEFKAIFADFGADWKQIDQRTVIEHGLTLINN